MPSIPQTREWVKDVIYLACSCHPHSLERLVPLINCLPSLLRRAGAGGGRGRALGGKRATTIGAAGAVSLASGRLRPNYQQHRPVSPNGYVWSAQPSGIAPLVTAMPAGCHRPHTLSAHAQPTVCGPLAAEGAGDIRQLCVHTQSVWGQGV